MLMGLGAQLVFALIAFAGSLTVARLLGPGGRGAFAALTLAGTLGAVILTLGIPAGLGRAVLTGRGNGVVRSALVHAGLATMLAIPVTLVAVVAAPQWALAATVVGLVLAPLTVVIEDLAAASWAGKALAAFHVPRIMNAAVFTGSAIVFLLADVDPTVTTMVVCFTLGTVLAAGVATAWLAASWTSNSRIPLGYARALGSGTYTGVLVDRAILRLDHLILWMVSGPTALGLYGVAVNWAEVGQYLGNAVGMTTFEDDRTLSDRAAVKTAVLAAAAVAVLMAPVCAAAWMLTGPVFGDRFEDARVTVVLLAPGVIARAAAFTGSQALTARGRGAAASRAAVVTLGAGLILWTGGAALLGRDGAAVANSVVYTIQAVLVVWMLWRPGRGPGVPGA